jgi:cytochrome bd-type quinol oxidase subunit 2
MKTLGGEMTGQRGSADTLFTIFTAICAIAVAVTFILIGSAVARATFNPDHARHENAVPHS